MGASASIDLRPEEIDELAESVSYESKEVRTLYKRFRRLDRSGKGTISVDDLLMIPEIVMNPLASRLVQTFEKDSEDRINFRSFVIGLSVYNEKATPEIKAKGLFRIFDVDNDGFLSEEDLATILAMMAGKSLSPEAADEIVKRTMAEVDYDRDGKISESDFFISMSDYPWETFIVPVKKTSREQYFLQLDEKKDSAFGAMKQ